jgi:imidazolonepropionase-like amidohydrolase
MASLLIHNATLIDGNGGEPRANTSVLTEDGRITRIGPHDVFETNVDTSVIDASGRYLLPGLTDAHVHLGLTENNGQITQPLSAYSVKLIGFIEAALYEGFTTVRDAGGLDPSWAGVVSRGMIPGPRILPSGAFLSQTGGHGDHRAAYMDDFQWHVPGLIGGAQLCDGPHEVRKAARDQLRRGATQIKVMASGGAASPTDPIEATQFTVEELRAAVEEAQARNTYVLAHAYHAKSIANCVEAGVRSIEHGNLLDEETAARMAAAGAFLVPTMVTYDVLSQFGDQLGLTKFQHQKIRMVAEGAQDSVRMASEAGVRIASGSDLLGAMMNQKAREFALKAEVIGPMPAIVSATKTNAELFGMADSIGTVEEGKQADLVVVDGDPLSDITVLADASRIRQVVKDGEVMKDLDGPA